MSEKAEETVALLRQYLSKGELVMLRSDLPRDCVYNGVLPGDLARLQGKIGTVTGERDYYYGYKINWGKGTFAFAFHCEDLIVVQADER